MPIFVNQLFADIILPLPLPGYFTYSLPADCAQQARVGCRVVVSFGKKKLYTGVIVTIHGNAPQGYATKPIHSLLDTEPVLLPLQLRFWDWIASYYLCAQGDVYKAALPSGLKLESETRVVYNPDFAYPSPLAKREQHLLDILAADPEQTISRLEKESGQKNILAVVKSLLDKEAIRVKEELRKSYKPKTETRVKLTAAFANERLLAMLLNDLARAPKQLALLMRYLELAGYGQPVTTIATSVSKAELLNKTEFSPAVLTAMVGKGIFEAYQEETGRLLKAGAVGGEQDINPLNPAQQRAFDSLQSLFPVKNVCLLHGVTSSGKTEVYIHLIQDMITRGKQVLYLLPEIALTTQITERLRRVFGDQLGIYHSKFPDAERVEIWKKQLSDQPYRVILGARSAVFLPFSHLGLVIVDEEHETSYKQQDPAPRYHARNAAVVLASMCGAKVLLGTATPSVETYYNATTGKFGLVELKERYRDIQMPEVVPVDIGELRRKKRMSGEFSPLLIEEMRRALEQGEQVILFQNRRGYAPMVECHVCGWVPKCKFCDVSLTYHKRYNALTCHYCGYTEPYPAVCPACEGTDLKSRGFGTEKVEDEIQLIFPHASIGRMDLDTTRTRTAYERIISDFEQRRINILIGTQMISKGLDFDHVSVVGILNADAMLNYPDFRSYERAYQLMAQVSGRAGRKNKRGLVLLQTKLADNPIIGQVRDNNYEEMYQTQLAERQLFRYPPYYRLIAIYMKGKTESAVDTAAAVLAAHLRAVFADRVLGPDKPSVGRVQALFIKKIILKVEMNASMTKVKEQLLRIKKEVGEDERCRGAVMYYDVDPM